MSGAASTCGRENLVGFIRRQGIDNGVDVHASHIVFG